MKKVLAVRASWHEEHPDLHERLMRAVLDAADWLEDPSNLETAVDIAIGKRYVNTSRAPLRAAVFGEIQAGHGRVLKPEGFLRFSGKDANFPNPEHARFYLEQMWRQGHIDSEQAQSVDLKSICLDGFYRECMARP